MFRLSFVALRVWCVCHMSVRPSVFHAMCGHVARLVQERDRASS